MFERTPIFDKFNFGPQVGFVERARETLKIEK
jgi:hypothetical protein